MGGTTMGGGAGKGGGTCMVGMVGMAELGTGGGSTK